MKKSNENIVNQTLNSETSSDPTNLTTVKSNLIVNLKHLVEHNRDYEPSKANAIARDLRTIEWVKTQQDICFKDGYILQPGKSPTISSRGIYSTSSASFKPTTPISINKSCTTK